MTRHLRPGFRACILQQRLSRLRACGSLLLTLAALAGCRGDSAPPGAAAAGGRGAGPATPVEVVAVAPTPLDRVGEFVGTLRSRTSTTIQPQAEGFLTRILVTSGDRVSPGAPLFEIDSSTGRVALSALESLRAAREADAAFARQQADRAKALLAAGAASQQEFEQATTQQKTAEAQLKAIEEQIRQQQTELGYYRVTAPTAGLVGDIPVRQGDRVTRTTLLTTLDDNTGLEVYIRVPVQQAPGLKPGLPVRLLDESGAIITTERIAYVSPAVDDATQTVLVKAPVDAARGSLRTDQFIRTDVVFDTVPGLTVPIVSATRINGQYFVFVAEKAATGTVARQRAITVGRTVGNGYVVTGGLTAGEQLIVGGIQKIGDGAPVSPVPAAPAAPAGAAPAPAGGREGGRGR